MPPWSKPLVCWAGVLAGLNLSAASSPQCSVCHKLIAEAFAGTGMGRSINLTPTLHDEPAAAFYHRASNRHYRLAGGAMRRHQVDAQGREVNVVEKRIDFAIGSGNHAVTYMHRSPEGRLVQLPVSRYTLDGWQMSPGYDRPDHSDFRREIGDTCLFCHSGGPEPEPIGCARCHGDGAAHIAKPARGNIVNPRRLPPQRELEVCLQCHLETASRGFPDSARQPGRAVFSFRPGQALATYKAYFDRDDGKDRFEVNHSGYRLLQSKCFTQSEGRLTCIACHDAHTAKVRAGSCAQCHSSVHAREPTDCAGCHMPKRRTEDAVHVRMTDHKILRRPSAAPEPTREDHAPYQAALVPFYKSVDPKLVELVRLRHRADLGRASETDYRRWLALDPQSPTAMTALAVALMQLGNSREAVPLLEQALRAEPANLSALNAMAVNHASAGEFAKALQLLERSRAANPDHPLTWINLGATHEAQGRPDRAAAAYREAVRHQPDSSEARRRLNALGAAAYR